MKKWVTVSVISSKITVLLMVYILPSSVAYVHRERQKAGRLVNPAQRVSI